MPDEPATTRAKLIDAASRLFAERGAFSVSLAEVVREAGQRNASAVHYHFGSREQVLLAIMEPTAQRLRARRLELLEAARSGPPDDARPVAEAVVRPLVELARQGWRERAWMKIGMELNDYEDRISPELRAVLSTAGGSDAIHVLAERVAPLPDEVRLLRSAVCISFVVRAATDRARLLDEPTGHRAERATAGHPMLSDEAFVQNLIDMFLGAFTSPLTTVAGAPVAPPAPARRRAARRIAG